MRAMSERMDIRKQREGEKEKKTRITRRIRTTRLAKSLGTPPWAYPCLA